jgi:catechol 2,3-dioxygenase-like lactoylglutathione lyase family enzyme
MTNNNLGIIGQAPALDHIAIMVPDLQEGIDWYTAKFGAQVLDRWDNPDAGMEWAHLAIGNFTLELVKRNELAEKAQGTWGYHHVALTVDDCDEAVRSLQESGVTVVMPPSDFERHKIRWSFVSDYLGNIYEIISPMPNPEMER